MTFLRPAPICLVVAGLLLVLQVLSYSSLHYVHPGRSWRISLGQGQLRLWRSNPGDLNYMPAGFSTGGGAFWSFDAILWKPEWNTRQDVWVPLGPAGTPPGPGGVNVKSIRGLSIAAAPMYPGLLAAIVGAAAMPGWKRSRRKRRGQCVKCGYDRRGLAAGAACPECGEVSKALAAGSDEAVLPSNPESPGA